MVQPRLIAAQTGRVRGVKGGGSGGSPSPLQVFSGTENITCYPAKMLPDSLKLCHKGKEGATRYQQECTHHQRPQKTTTDRQQGHQALPQTKRIQTKLLNCLKPSKERREGQIKNTGEQKNWKEANDG